MKSKAKWKAARKPKGLKIYFTDKPKARVTEARWWLDEDGMLCVKDVPPKETEAVFELVWALTLGALKVTAGGHLTERSERAAA